MDLKKNVRLIVPLLIIIVFSVLAATAAMQGLEYRIYDLCLHLKRDIKEDPRLLLVDIDDTSIEKVGVWPWSRDIMGDGLILMKEMGAGYAVFDIEYVQQSPMAVDPQLLQKEIPELFRTEFSSINSNIEGLFGAVVQGDLPPEAAADYVAELSAINEQTRDLLLERVNHVTRDNDDYFAMTSYFYGDLFFTVNMVMDYEVEMDSAYHDWLMENIPYKKIDVETDNIPSADSLDPAIPELMTEALGAGFPNIIIDEDGVRRRVDLFYEHKGSYFPQLVMAPLLKWLGEPQLVLTDRYLEIRDAAFPGEEEKRTVRLPRDEGGKFLINWPAKGYPESFRHLSAYYLILHGWQEKALIENLKLLEADNYFYYYEGDQDLFAGYNYAESIKQEIMAGGDRRYIQDYRDSREYFFNEVGKFLSGQAEAAITGQIEEILASGQLEAAEEAEYRDIAANVVKNFSELKTLYEDLIITRNKVREAVDGSFCIIGSSATSTFDRGVNPFSKEYANVGTHAAVANMIIQDSFLDETPSWVPLILTVLLSALVFWIIRSMKPLPSLLSGFGIIILIIAGCMTLFVITGTYVQMLPPVLSVLSIFIFLSFAKFLETAREKAYIRNAFGHYLSDTVIDNLIADPDKLNLGGEKKELTAIFTDVKGFSTISEKVDPTELVTILNMYLTEMSNLIMSQGGTIDKYEGDAIIAFFGAPVDFDDHAKRACRAAVRMKKMERLINEHLQRDNISPDPLFTRIGINTGEMVVGNMGTARKMDYTIMGNAVNLAARLEGVNKQYNCWKLISSSTADQLGDEFLLRKLDRVRVVGIHEPVRLYELVDEAEMATAEMLEIVEIFHKGLELFERKMWNEASAMFQEVLNIDPEDGPGGVYLKRCSEYIKKAPPENWDGVFNLTTK